MWRLVPQTAIAIMDFLGGFLKSLQTRGALKGQWCGPRSAFRFAGAGAGSPFAWGVLGSVLCGRAGAGPLRDMMLHRGMTGCHPWHDMISPLA